MIIAVASGKGGTGKTTVAVSLALAVVSERSKSDTMMFLDCDVEAPNAHLFLKPVFNRREEVAIPIPQVDFEKCTYCGRCAEVCVYHAIAVAGQQVLIFPELCHGCGSCTLECPEDAIREVPNVIGSIEEGQADGIDFAQGMLDIGQPMAVPVIRQLKQHVDSDCLVIVDASPGTSCPVVEAIQESDFALLVTEPTPFGLHDLRLMVQVARDELGLPVGVLINRDGIGDEGVDEYCAEEQIPVLMRIPFDRRIAEAYSEGKALVEALPEYLEPFQELYNRIKKEVGH